MGNASLNRAVADQASQPPAAAGLVQGPEPTAAGQASEKKEREALWTGVLNVDQVKNQLKVTLTAIFPHEAMEQLADKMNPKRDNLHVTWRVPSADEEIPACIIRSRDFYAQDDIIPCETCVVMDIYNMFGGAAFDELLSVVRGTTSHILVAELPTLRREDLEKAPILSRLLACTPPPPQEGRAAQVWEPPYRLYLTPSVVPADRFDMEKGSKQLFLCLTGSRYQVQELSTWDKEWAGTPIVKHDPPDGNQAVGPKRVAWRMAGSDDDDLPQHQPVHDKGIAQREKLQEKEKDIKNALTQRPSAEEEAEDAAAEAAERQAAAGALEPAQVQWPAAEHPAAEHPVAAEAGVQASAASQLLTADQSASSEGHTNTEQQLPAVLQPQQPVQPAQAHVPTAPPALAEDFAHQASAGLAGLADDSSRPEGHLDASVEEDAETGTPTAEVASRPLDSMVLSTGAGASGQPMEAIVSQSLHPAPGTAQQGPNWRHALPAGMGAAACVSSSGRLWSWRDVQAPSLAAEHVESTAAATKAPVEWKWSQRSLPVLQMPCMEQPNSISRELRIRLPHLWGDLQVLRSAPLRGLRLLLVASEVEKHQMEAGLQQAQLVLGLKWAWRVPSAPAPEDLSEYQVLALGSSAMEALSDRGSNIFLKSVGVHPIHVFSAEPLVNSLRLLVEEAMQPDDQAGEASVPTLSRAAQLLAGGGVPLFPDRVVIVMDAQGFMDSSPQVLRQLLGCLEAGTQAWGEPWTLRMRKADIEQVQRAGGEHYEIVQGALDGAQGPLLVALTSREESTKLGDKLLRDAVRLLHETKPGRLVVQAYTSRQATEEVVKKGRLCKDVLSGAVEEVLAFLDLILMNGWQHAGPGLQPM
ncbi:hypothetical protein HYH03_003707 [Edaphochlamys debaryana]|uniref:Uncharacterized protein n=1 Tax=Edaphochlamys debaryana TaxID=47281 RepID=A0A835Y8X1_9CHLO|nr:hypothetical protein HYH03_003707 [Edaphochlamys debaryana]|eukprot:KAG2498452.1 hypothetical protein HYH03_003707 [Edaphochlamys debaryana]